MTMTGTDVPAGFEPGTRSSPLTTPWEPLYYKTEPRRIIIGVRVREAHCNSRGFAHGGLIAALADNAMGISAGQSLRAEGRSDVASLVTVSLNTDYMGAAQQGSWLEFRTEVGRLGGSLCFTSCIIAADGEPVARASATFKIVKARQPA